MPKLDLNLFLTPDDIEGETEIEILEEGKYSKITTPDGEKEILVVPIKLPSGEKRDYTMNLTSQRMVARLYGQDTKKWVGKKVTIEKVKQNVAGKMKEVIYVVGKHEKESTPEAKPTP